MKELESQTYQTDIAEFTKDSVVSWTTEEEIKQLRKGARQTRYPIRNELIVLMLYRHGLRESELCNLKLEHLNTSESKIFIKRAKGSNDMMHPIAGDELRLIRRYLKEREEKKGIAIDFPYLFVSERNNQLSRFTVIKIIESCYLLADIRKISPHMLRHGCGYYLANKGYDIRIIQDYLGHKNIQNTVRYTRLSSRKFEGIWG